MRPRDRQCAGIIDIQPRRIADIDGLRLPGHIGNALPQGIVRLQFGKPGGRAVIRDGLDWLLAAAAGVDLPFVEFFEDEHARIGPHVREPIRQAAATQALRALLALRTQGLQQPLPFAPYSGWELFSATTPEKGVKAAAQRWRGSERSWAEGEGDALRLALRARDPFADTEALRAFADVTGTVFGAVTRGAPKPVELADAALPEADDAEDAA